MSNRLANYAGHEINILANSAYDWPAYDILPSLKDPARAKERPMVIGAIAIEAMHVHIYDMEHAYPIGLPVSNATTLGIASLDTLRAVVRTQARSGHELTLDGYAAPDDIVRDGSDIVGAQGVAIPEFTATPGVDRLVRLEHLSIPPIEQWQNFGPFPINLFTRDTPDVINPAKDEAVFTIPPSSNPTNVRRERRLEGELSEQFNVAVFRTSPGEIINPQFPEPGGAAFMPPEAIRMYAKLGLPVDNMFVLGKLVRDTKGKIQGGRAIQRLNARMLAEDPF